MAPADIVFGGTSSFLIGVLAASAGWNTFVVISGAVITGLLLAGFGKFAPRFGIIFAFCVFLGIFYYHLYLNAKTTNEIFPENERIIFTGVVVNEPKVTEEVQQFLLELEPPYAGKVNILTAAIPERAYGERLRLEGRIKRSAYRFLPREEATSFFPKLELLESGRGFSLKARLIALKHTFIDHFRLILPRDHAALLAGLTFGYQSDFTKELRGKMEKSGTTHLVALSGYNISILVLVLAGTLGYFLGRRLTFWGTTLGIIFFVLMVGAEASVVRAAIMGFLVLLAKESGRIYSMRNAISSAAFFMALYDPTVLFFDIGFELSFLSLMGIAYLEPAIRNILKIREESLRSFLNWKENALTTFSAQLAVAPLLISNFGSISLTALLANVLILTFVPATMALGFLTAAASLIFAPLSQLIAWAADVLLIYELSVISFFSKFAIPLGGVNSRVIFLFYYMVLIFIILFYFNGRGVKSK